MVTDYETRVMRKWPSRVRRSPMGAGAEVKFALRRCRTSRLIWDRLEQTIEDQLGYSLWRVGKIGQECFVTGVASMNLVVCVCVNVNVGANENEMVNENGSERVENGCGADC